MNFRTVPKFPGGKFVLICFLSALIAGCRPNVDYSPRPAQKSASSNQSSAGKVKSDLPERTKGASFVGKDAATAVKPESALIAYDEFDGVHRGGWKEPGLGEWANSGVERDGAFVVSGDADVFRALAEPATGGVLWYAVTMRMESPVTGIASVDGSPGPPKRYGKLGFSAVDKPFTSRGFWMETERDTNIENTELQTFLTRYNFDAHNSEGFASRGFGIRLIDRDGMVLARPRVKMDGRFNADLFTHLSLKKSGPEKMIVERVAIARTAEAALVSVAPVTAPRPGTQTAAPEATQAAQAETTGADTAKTDAAAPAGEAKDEKSETKAEQPAAQPGEPKNSKPEEKTVPTAPTEATPAPAETKTDSKTPQ
jgi:hypothetical protein